MAATTIVRDGHWYSVGLASPASDSPAKTWLLGSWRRNINSANQASIAGWYCSVAGTPGTWVAVGIGVSSITGSTYISITGTAAVPIVTYIGPLGTVTSVTATAPISSSGGATPNITHDTSGLTAGTFAYPSSMTFDNKGHASSITPGSAPVASVTGSTYISITGTATNPIINYTGGTGGGTVTSVTASSPLASSGGTTPNISHNGAIAAGAVAYPASITFDAYGHATAATGGSAPVASVSGSTYISITGTATNPIVNYTGAVGGITQLTGDVAAGPGSGSVGSTIQPNVVGFTKLVAASAGQILIGRGTGAGNFQEIALGAQFGIVSGLLTSLPPFSMQFGGFMANAGTVMPIALGQGVNDFNTTGIAYDAPWGCNFVNVTYNCAFNSCNATVTIQLYVNGSLIGTIGTLATATTGTGSQLFSTTVAANQSIQINLTGATAGTIDIRIALLGFYS